MLKKFKRDLFQLEFAPSHFGRVFIQLTHPAQPEGLQESSRWSESAETTGKVVRSGTPPGCDLITFAFPVVSADSDHRLLSMQPFGLLELSERSRERLVTSRSEPVPKCPHAPRIRDARIRCGSFQLAKVSLHELHALCTSRGPWLADAIPFRLLGLIPEHRSSLCRHDTQAPIAGWESFRPVAATRRRSIDGPPRQPSTAKDCHPSNDLSSSVGSAQ